MSRHVCCVAVMPVTFVQEGEAFLAEKGKPDPDAVTRGQQQQLDAIQTEAETAAKKPRLTKDNTMVATAKVNNNNDTVVILCQAESM